MNELHMQHGTDWQGQDLSGWYISEKFDGCRAFWDGQTLWSRGGIAIEIPDDWAEALPAGQMLDGELYFGVDGSRKCATAIRCGKFLEGMSYRVFDAPQETGGYVERLAAVEANAIVMPVSVRTAENSDDVLCEMRRIQERGGEGVMARHPGLGYQPGRTSQLLKVKYED